MAKFDRNAAVLASCALAAALLAPACGRKTPVRPLDLVVPSPIEGLAVTNVDKGIEVAWDRPTRYADGMQMLDLAGFRIERRRPCCGFVPRQLVEVEDRQRFRRAKRFRWVDEQVDAGESYTYRISAYTLDSYESKPTESEPIVREIPAKQP